MRRSMNLCTLGAAMSMMTAVACGGNGTSEGAEAAPPKAPAVAVEVVRSYPHDPTAFTQGLLFHQGALFESTGRYGESSVRRVELETGRVTARSDVGDQYFAEGLTLHGGRFYQLTWREGVGFLYDASLTPRGTFPFTGEGWGLTSDGTSLIVSDGSNVLRFLDPATYQETGQVQVTDGGEPVQMLNELEWIGGEVWANVWHDKRIARIDPRTGQVRGWLDLSQIIPTPRPTDGEAVLNGIAHDAATGRIFVTGKLWPELFEIRVPGLASSPAPAAPAGDSAGAG